MTVVPTPTPDALYVVASNSSSRASQHVVPVKVVLCLQKYEQNREVLVWFVSRRVLCHSVHPTALFVRLQFVRVYVPWLYSRYDQYPETQRKSSRRPPLRVFFATLWATKGL